MKESKLMVYIKRTIEGPTRCYVIAIDHTPVYINDRIHALSTVLLLLASQGIYRPINNKFLNP